MSGETGSDRSSLGILPKPVCVIGTRTEHGNPTGLAVPAIVELGSPPTHLAFFARQDRESLMHIQRSGLFSVSLLPADLEILIPTLMGGLVWVDQYDRAPIVSGSIVIYYCELSSMVATDESETTLVQGSIQSHVWIGDKRVSPGILWGDQVYGLCRQRK